MKKYLLLVLLVSCATSPTGRQQLAFMPDSLMNSLGASNFADMKKKTPLSRNSRVVNYVNCVANAVAAEASDAGVESWEVQVFDTKDVNAFAVPGGKIGVYDGILKVANSPGQLAAVLGHEVAHVTARHGNERVSTALAGQIALVGIDKALKDNKNKGAIMAGLGLGFMFGVQLPFGRGNESEADEMGIMYSARAGFDPRESVTLWQNMAKAGGGKMPEFMSTHPSHETRISDLQRKMGPALAAYEKAKSQGKNPNCVYPY